MEKTIELLDFFVTLPPEKQVFVMAILAIAATSFALYVVLVAIRYKN